MRTKRLILGMILVPVIAFGQALKPEMTPGQRNEIRSQLRAISAEMSPDTCAVQSYIGPFDLEKQIRKILEDSVNLEGLKDCQTSFGFSIIVNCDGQLMASIWPASDQFDECNVEFAKRIAAVIKRTKVDPPLWKERQCNWLFDNNRAYLRYDFDYQIRM